MRVLVTGSEGYIGAVLVPILVSAGHDVTGLDTCYFTETDFLPASTAIPLTRKDVRDIESEDLRDIDAVVHLAALSNDPLGDIDPDLTVDINFRATLRCAELARDAGAQRFIFASSCSMYGVSGGEVLDERSPLSPQTAYARSKVDSEKEIRLLARDGFSPVFLRNGTAYGISPRQRFDLVLPDLAGSAWVHRSIRMISDGTPWRPLVHIRDISQAILCSLEAPVERIHNEAFNVGANEENYQIRDIAHMIHEIDPEAEVVLGTKSPADTRDYHVDFSKAREGLPKFAPRWTLRRGIQECFETFKQVDLSAATFKHRLHRRVSQIRFLQENGRIDSKLRWKN